MVDATTGTGTGGSLMGRRSRLALPASRRHIWWALAASILVSWGTQLVAVSRGTPLSQGLGSALSYDAYCVAYLALTWRALPRMRPADLAGWAAQVDARPPGRFRHPGECRGVRLRRGRLGPATRRRARPGPHHRPHRPRRGRGPASWLLVHTAYATRYAYAYYRSDGDRGLSFPGDGAPECLDFAYFSCSVATTFGTTDVEVCSSRFRRIVLGLVSFGFNTGVLALTFSVLVS